MLRACRLQQTERQLQEARQDGAAALDRTGQMQSAALAQARHRLELQAVQWQERLVAGKQEAMSATRCFGVGWGVLKPVDIPFSS